MPFKANVASVSAPVLRRLAQTAASPTCGDAGGVSGVAGRALRGEHFRAGLQSPVGIADLQFADALGHAALQVLRGRAAQQYFSTSCVLAGMLSEGAYATRATIVRLGSAAIRQSTTGPFLMRNVPCAMR